MKQTNKKQETKQTVKSNISSTIRNVAVAYSSGMYDDNMIASLLSKDGFSDNEIIQIMEAAAILRESMYSSLKVMAGIINN